MEDFNILIKDLESGEYRLLASATLFPTGWCLQERIGTSMALLHAPVPGWKEKMSRSVNRYFDQLNSKSCMERTNLFLQASPELFLESPEDLASRADSLTPSDMQVRRERQTFRRLESSNAVLFTVRTFMAPLAELGSEELKGLAEQVRVWGEDQAMASYKGVDVWGNMVVGWCEREAGS